VFHVKHEGSTAGLPLSNPGVTLSEEQIHQLERFESLLRERAIPSGFVAATDAPRLRERHIWDCLRAGSVTRSDERTAYDLGSGAGLPGIVVAIACPWLAITLVESRRPRVAFLELALEQLGLTNALVHAGRAQDLSDRVDVCFARAFADPVASWRVAEPLLVPHGRLVYFAGRGFDRSQLPNDLVASLVASTLARSGPLVIMSRK
jgi:16S rRNA (guanine(527)-N(7))-methyltransferase RsmG